jgi:hypothetical protein
MSMEKRFLEAHGIQLKEQEKFVNPKIKRIEEAANYVHRNIVYQLENLGGSQWALMIVNKENKEKFEKHPIGNTDMGTALNSCSAIDFDNWDTAKQSLIKLGYKQLGALAPSSDQEDIEYDDLEDLDDEDEDEEEYSDEEE